MQGHDDLPDQKVWEDAKDGSSFKMTGDCSVAILKKLEGIWNEETRFRRPKQCASECVGLFLKYHGNRRYIVRED